MLNALDNLPEDPVELRRVTELLASEVKAQALMIEKLQHQLHGANRHRFGSKSEGMDQLQLLAENEEIAEAAVKAAETAPAEPIELKEKPRRKPLPDHLERIEQVLSVGEDCPECGGDLSKLGEDITEELEYIPGRFVVNKITRPRMACRRCEAISQAPMPSRPIERGRPGPGLLAHVLVRKFADHLPLYRQSQIYAREGVDLDRSTMADWVGKSTGLLEPLAEAIAKRAKGGTSLFADDTPLKMLAPGNKKTKTARIWAYVRDERPWSGPCATGAQTDNLSSCAGRAPPCVWYQFTVDRKGEHPVKHLSGYQGWVSCGWHAGEGKATEVACMAHIRMAMPVSTACSVKVKPRKWPAWPTSDASLSMCLPHKVPPLPRRPSSGLRNCMVWKNRQGANLPRPVLLCVKKMQSPSSMIWKNGCATNCPKYRANHLWQRPFDMPWAVCPKHGPTSTTAFWSWTTTPPNAP